MTKLINALMLGQAQNEEKAAGIAASMQGCPYIDFYTHEGRLVCAMFAIPEHKKWWLQLPEEEPGLMAMERIELFYPVEINASSPWSRGEVAPHQEITPCGSHCDRCPQYSLRCEGCPATVWYKSE